jgi:hypothetical protein
VLSAYVRVWHLQWHVTLKLEQADMRQPRLAYQCRLTSPLALSCWSCGLNGRQLGAKYASTAILMRARTLPREQRLD